MKDLNRFTHNRNREAAFGFAAVIGLALFFLPATAFAVTVPAELETLADNFAKIFTGKLVRTILVISLCATAIAFGINKDNDKVRRNCIAIGIAAGILLFGSGIVDAIWTAGNGSLN